MKRWLAREWLILMAIFTIATLYQAKHLYDRNSKLTQGAGDTDFEIFFRQHTGETLDRLKQREEQSPLTVKFWGEASAEALIWVVVIYCVLWVPRLTVSSIRLLRSSANKAAHP